MWIMVAPAAIVLRMVFKTKKDGGEVKVKTTDRVIEKFYKEYAIAIESMEDKDRECFEEAISLLEHFIRFCKKDERANAMRHLMLSIITARNCWHGLNNEYEDADAMPMIIAGSSEMFIEVIEDIALNAKQERQALEAVDDLIFSLESSMGLHIKDLSTDYDPKLKEKRA